MWAGETEKALWHFQDAARRHAVVTKQLTHEEKPADPDRDLRVL